MDPCDQTWEFRKSWGLCLLGEGPKRYPLSQSAWVPVIEYHTLGGLKNSNSFSDSAGSWQPEIKVPTWSVSGETLLLACGLPAMSSCNMKGPLVSSSSYKDSGAISRTLTS